MKAIHCLALFAAIIAVCIAAYHGCGADNPESIDSLIVQHPDDYELHYLQGLMLYSEGNFSGAILHFDIALKLNDNPVAESLIMTGIADSLAQSGRYSSAIEAYDIALYIDPNNTHAAENKAELAVYINNTE